MEEVELVPVDVVVLVEVELLDVAGAWAGVAVVVVVDTAGPTIVTVVELVLEAGAVGAAVVFVATISKEPSGPRFGSPDPALSGA